MDSIFFLVFLKLRFTRLKIIILYICQRLFKLRSKYVLTVNKKKNFFEIIIHNYFLLAYKVFNIKRDLSTALGTLIFVKKNHFYLNYYCFQNSNEGL